MVCEGIAAQHGVGALKRTDDLLHSQISLFTPQSKLSSASQTASVPTEVKLTQFDRNEEMRRTL